MTAQDVYLDLIAYKVLLKHADLNHAVKQMWLSLWMIPILSLVLIFFLLMHIIPLLCWKWKVSLTVFTSAHSSRAGLFDMVSALAELSAVGRLGICAGSLTVRKAIRAAAWPTGPRTPASGDGWKQEETGYKNLIFESYPLTHRLSLQLLFHIFHSHVVFSVVGFSC